MRSKNESARVFMGGTCRRKKCEKEWPLSLCNSQAKPCKLAVLSCGVDVVFIEGLPYIAPWVSSGSSKKFSMRTLTPGCSECGQRVKRKALHLRWDFFLQGGCNPKSKGFGDKQWVCIPIPFLVTSSKLLDLSEPRFAHPAL